MTSCVLLLIYEQSSGLSPRAETARAKFTDDRWDSLYPRNSPGRISDNLIQKIREIATNSGCRRTVRCSCPKETNLEGQRTRYAKKLRRAIQANAPQLPRDLKRSSRRVEKVLRNAVHKPHQAEAAPATMARAIQIASELNSPAHLNRDNLHPYRLKVKELRDVLQLSDRADSQDFIEGLGQVKDAIGDWHDREKLTAVARQLLHHGGSCKVVKELKMVSNDKYETALSLANRLRRTYLKANAPKRGTRQPKTTLLSNSVLRAASAIAEH